MNRFHLFSITCLAAIASAPALAQQTQGPGPWGYGHMMWGGGGWGWHPGMIFGPIVMIFIVVCTVALVLWMMRGFGHGYHGGHGFCPHCGHGRGHAAQDILAERFAKGEIGKEEFEEKRRLLGR
jgi:putative membrane protein